MTFGPMYIKIALRRLPIDDHTGDGYERDSETCCRNALERITEAAGEAFVVSLCQDREPLGWYSWDAMEPDSYEQHATRQEAFQSGRDRIAAIEEAYDSGGLVALPVVHVGRIEAVSAMRPTRDGLIEMGLSERGER